jgi:ABC-2 type transport system permease protein
MKAWNIAWKDTYIRFRDRNAILVNLAAPLLLAALIGLAFGNLGGEAPSPLQDIPIAVIDEDAGELGAIVVNVLNSPDLADLLEHQEVASLEAARGEVEQGNLRAVVHIPAGFTETLMEANDPGGDIPQSEIVIYTDPSSTLTPVIVRNIVEQIIIGMNRDSISARIAVDQLVNDYAEELGPRLAGLEAAISAEFAQGSGVESQANPVTINTSLIGNENQDDTFNPLAYFAPGMAIFFLMFTMVDAARSILDEKLDGTLDRLLSTPTSALEIIGGKVGGVFVTGLVQMTILIVVSAIVFQLDWGGSILAVALLVIAVVGAASSLGIAIAAFASQPNQVQIVGSAVALISGILGGNFIDASALPAWLDPISRLTVNRWAMDGFMDLTIFGQGLQGVLDEVAVLVGMSLVFFLIGVWQLHRRLRS